MQCQLLNAALLTHTHFMHVQLVSQPLYCTMSFYESGLMQHEAHRCQLSWIGQDCPRLPLSRKKTAIVIPPWYNSFSLDFYLWFHITWELSQWCLLEHPHNNLHLVCIGKHGGRYELLSLHWNCVLYTFLSWNLVEKVSTKLQIIMAIAMQQHWLSYRQIQHCRAASKHLTLIGKAWVTWKVNLPSLWIPW